MCGMVAGKQRIRGAFSRAAVSFLFPRCPVFAPEPLVLLSRVGELLTPLSKSYGITCM